MKRVIVISFLEYWYDLKQTFRNLNRILVILVTTFILIACTHPEPQDCIKPLEDKDIDSCGDFPFPGCALPTSDQVFVCRSSPLPQCIGTDGKGVTADTAFSWFKKVANTERLIDSQLSGHAAAEAYGGSWDNATLVSLRGILKYGENGDRYVRYVIAERRKAGLPELQGLPDNWEQMGRKCITPHRDQLRYPYPDYYYRMDELAWPQTQTVHSE